MKVKLYYTITSEVDIENLPYPFDDGDIENPEERRSFEELMDNINSFEMEDFVKLGKNFNVNWGYEKI